MAKVHCIDMRFLRTHFFAYEESRFPRNHLYLLICFNFTEMEFGKDLIQNLQGEISIFMINLSICMSFHDVIKMNMLMSC